MANVVITTHWLDGDVIPFVRIGKELKKRGHEVTLLTHCYFEGLVKQAGLNFEPWDTPEKYARMVEAMNGEHLSGQNAKITDSFHDEFESNDVYMKEYEKVLKYCKEKDTVLLSKNRSSIAALLVAEKHEIPIASVFMGPTEVRAMISFDIVDGDKKLPELNELRSRVGLSPIQNWFQWINSPNMTLALWPEWYAEPDENWPKSIEMVGFPIETNIQRDQEIPEELKEILFQGKAPLLISGGTTKMIKPEFYPASIAACGLMDRPAIVLTRYKELLPKQLPDNVKWYSYLPLDAVMPYLGGIIHHGGMGTLGGALLAGVPQLILPCYIDRPYNAALCKELGVAAYLLHHKWTPENIVVALNDILEPGVREKCKIYADKMKEYDAISTVANRVEELVGNLDYIIKPTEDYKVNEFRKTEKIDENKAYIIDRTKQMSKDQRALLIKEMQKRRG